MKENNDLHIEMDERIERFLRGQMSTEEADAMRTDMKNDPELRQRAVLQAQMIRQMRQVGEEKRQRIADAMRATDSQTIEQIAKVEGEKLLKVRKPLMRRLTPWIAAAAVLLCIVLVGHNAYMPKPEAQESVKVAQVTKKPKRTHRDRLEEIAMLKGKIDMGMDLEASTKRLQAIYNEGKKSSKSVYASVLDDIALALAEGYNKIGNKEAEQSIITEMMERQDGPQVADK